MVLLLEDEKGLFTSGEEGGSFTLGEGAMTLPLGEEKGVFTAGEEGGSSPFVEEGVAFHLWEEQDSPTLLQPMDLLCSISAWKLR